MKKKMWFGSERVKNKSLGGGVGLAKKGFINERKNI